MEPKSSLKDLARVFLKLGFTAFGGPAVHIAMMEEEFVRRRGWLDRQKFLDLLGASQLIPGPNSTELAIHIGRERGGWKGLLVAGFCFIGPAVLLTSILAFLYSRYGALPNAQAWIYGIRPAVMAVVMAAVVPLATNSAKSALLIALGVAALALCLHGVPELAVLFGAGAVGALAAEWKGRGVKSDDTNAFAPLLLMPLLTKGGLFLSFLKIGAILYGSGYVLFAFLEDEFVVPGLLTQQQLADAIAVGQFTPGPVFSSATFIGWQLDGPVGAALATLGIFLPSFLFVAAMGPLVERLRSSKIFAGFLDAVNIASVAAISAVVIQMGRESFTDWQAVMIAVVSAAVVLVRPKLNSAWVILGGAVAGRLLAFL